MSRLKFVDWARGVAVIVMIVSHSFNAFTDPQLHNSGLYRLAQFVGGMASVLFLFLAGLTLAFRMSSGDRKSEAPLARWKAALSRSGYVLLLAYGFRVANWLGYWPGSGWETILKVDILNCMGLAMLVLAVTALWQGASRAQAALVLGCLIAAAAPLAGAWDWTGTPLLLRDYFMPQRSVFGFLPWSAYLAFGISAGTVLCRLDPAWLPAAARWCALAGFAVVLGAGFLARLPWEFYDKPDFWVSSPAMVAVKFGLCLLLLAFAYAWAELALGDRWSWVIALGKTSLLVYFVHVALVYGRLMEPWRRHLTGFQTTLMTLFVIALMVALAEYRLSRGRNKA